LQDFAEKKQEMETVTGSEKRGKGQKDEGEAKEGQMWVWRKLIQIVPH